jgi:UDP-glucose 4-epimerase
MKIGIIGANGFIGRNLIDLLSRDTTISLKLFGRSSICELGDKYPYEQIELTNSEQITTSFKDIDIIYYLASSSIPSSSWENPIFDIENNLLPFINFLGCISKLNVKKIVFTSSAGTIYGSSDKESAENADKKPFSPHGINKLTMEYYLNYFEAKYNLKHDIFRISNIYGEGQNTSKGLGIINTFIEKILSNQKITVFGNGEIIRNYIYVKDVAKVLSYSLNSDYSKSNIYNLSTDDSLSINEIIDLIKKIVKENFSIDYLETRGSDNPKILLDNQKLKSDFPNLIFTHIQEGIKNTYFEIKNKI